jgi:translation initiation factor 4G
MADPEKSLNAIFETPEDTVENPEEDGTTGLVDVAASCGFLNRDDVLVAASKKAGVSKKSLTLQDLMNKPLVNFLENAWKPASKTDARVEDPVAVLKRKANLHLNKLTRENFGKILDEILGLKVDSYEGVEQIVSSLFKNAITQSYRGDVFADFSVELMKSTSVWQEEFIKVEEDDGKFYWTAGPTGRGGPYASSEMAKKEGKKKTQFKRILLLKCQTEFEKSKQLEREMKMIDDFASKEAAAKHADKLSMMKTNMLGNIIFIGQLYKKDSMPAHALECCFNELLPQSADRAPEEDNIDVCCRLLTSIGRKLEMGTRRRSRVGAEVIEGYCKGLHQIWTSKVLSNKVNFQILDLLKLHADKWKKTRQEVVTIANPDEDSDEGKSGSTKMCAVCFETIDEQNTVARVFPCAIIPCGHSSLCLNCATRIFHESKTCPICNQIMEGPPLRLYA